MLVWVKQLIICHKVKRTSSQSDTVLLRIELFAIHNEIEGVSVCLKIGNWLTDFLNVSKLRVYNHLLKTERRCKTFYKKI